MPTSHRILLAPLIDIAWNVLLILTSISSATSKLTIDPPGPVVVFDISNSKTGQHSSQIDVVLKCNNSFGNYQITWDFPTLNFAELSNQRDFNLLSAEGKEQNDLPNRVQITTSRTGSDLLFTSVLTIKNLSMWDEGYYTCRSTNGQNESISSRVYIFPFGLRIPFGQTSRNQGAERMRDIDPMRSFYVVDVEDSIELKEQKTEMYSMVIPCIVNYSGLRPVTGFRITLQHKTFASREWVQVPQERIRNWTYSTDFRGLEFTFSKADFGIYRCSIEITFLRSEQIGLFSEPFSILVQESRPRAYNNNMDNQLDKPMIRPTVKYVVFQPGSTFNLTCETRKSIGNITGFLPLSQIDVASTIKTTWKNITSDKTVLMLTVSNATYGHTGYYTCQSVENDQLSSELYVFVQDLNTLLTFTFRPYQTEPSIGNSNPHNFYQLPSGKVNVKASFLFPVWIRIIPTSPLVNVILYRLSGGSRTQIYPVLETDNSSEQWSYNLFEGFTLSNPSWKTAGDYVVEASLEREFQHNPNWLDSIIDRRQFTLPFSIYVEGIEIIPSAPQAIQGKQFSLRCRFKFPYHSTIDNPFPDSLDWYWTPQKNPVVDYENFSLYLGAEKTSWIGSDQEDPEKFFSSTLTFQNLTQQASGVFRCMLHYDVNSLQEGNFTTTYAINVLEPKAPVITESSPESGNLDVGLGENVILSCQVDALPRPDITWTDISGKPISDGFNHMHYSNGSSKTALMFIVTSGFNSGGEEFTCYFNNSEGAFRKTFRISLNKGGFSAGVYVAIAIAIAVFFILLGLLLRSIYLHKKRDKLIRFTRERLLNGDPGRIDPDISLEEQVNLLPYDPKWEFPRDRIIFGKQLGVGQFGVVVQAKQIGTVNDPEKNEVRPVAVKMVKSALNTTSLESLASELKILIHLGPHLNVVNLLGACTKEIANGELLVIEEFCQYGNIRDYLISNRDSFIDKRNDSINSHPHREQHQGRYLTMSPLDQAGKNLELLTYETETSSPDREPLTGVQNATRDSVLFRKLNGDSYDEDQIILLRNDGYLSPSGDTLERVEMTQTNRRTIKTRDLICWSFQVASGMEHLANKKVIHGDLAARNVLLSDGNVVKIADFGLSRQTKYDDGTYVKEGKEALPVKWMAIESLTDRIFTSQSDVWSYGVVLWELFSLGQMPYAEVTTLKDLMDFLRNDERLEKPSFMPNSMSDIMAKCWENDPKKRPTFSQLVRELGILLGDDVQDHYLKMNNSYMQMN